MSDVQHVPGPTLSVRANNDGQCLCDLCEEPFPPPQAAMLIRHPSDNTWGALCEPCTIVMAKAMQKALTYDEAIRIVAGL